VPFTNPIVAGLNLIRTAIRSPDYVAGVSGWTINKDGTCEFNDAVIRGELSAGGGNVILDNLGVHVIGPTVRHDINRTGGFVATNIPDNGVKTQIPPGGVFLTPQDPSPFGDPVDFVSIFAGYNSSGLSTEAPFLAINGVKYTGKSAPAITLYGQQAGDPNPDDTSYMQLTTVIFKLFATSAEILSNSIKVGNNGTFGWQNYTPAWSGSVTNPVINNGSILGRYNVTNGVCTFNIDISMGSTTTFGSGAYAFTLPVTPANQTSCSAFCQDSSAGLRAGGAGLLTAGSGVFRVVVRGNAVDSAAAGISSASPWAWANGDSITISGSYEV
jgi:hypothetical protein